MLHRSRPAQLLALISMIALPVSLADAKGPRVPADQAAATTTAAPAPAAITTATTTTAPASTAATTLTPSAPSAPTTTTTPAPAAAPAPGPPPAITIVPAQPVASSPSVLTVHNPPAGATDYRWDLDGSGSFATDTGAVDNVDHVFPAAGSRQVAVRITTGLATVLATLAVVVAAPAPAVHSPSHASARPAGGGTGLRARISSDSSDTISDFQFSPATITIHVGATITWTNNGPTAHTATASDHSFDTGTLQKGQSASHTFTTAGTFAYICTLHPFMHGTVVVQAAASSNTGSTTNSTPSSSTTTPSSATATTAAQTGQTLPLTGFDVIPRLLAGLLLLGGGIMLRRLATRP